MNQTSYSTRYAFFTKPLGPGHYDPSVELTKPKSHGKSWGTSPRNKSQEARQQPITKGGALVTTPGPGEYHFHNDTIQMKQIPNLERREEKCLRDREAANFQYLSSKVIVKPSTDQEKEKQVLHKMRKDHFSKQVGPGSYSVENNLISFSEKLQRKVD